MRGGLLSLLCKWYNDVDLLQNALPRDQKVRIVHISAVEMFNGKLPLAQLVPPDRLDQSVIELHITVKIPFRGRGLDIRLDLGARGVEMRPIGFRIEWEGLIHLTLFVNHLLPCRQNRKADETRT